MAMIDEVVSPALAEAEPSAHDEDQLRRMVQAGVESGAGIDADEAFARLRARFEALATR